MAKKRRVWKLNEFPSYKGGHTTVYGNYIHELSPGHRLQNMWGYVAQHRLVAEDKVGRPLRSGDHVHHIDENPMNNHPDNLVVLTMAEHRSLHGKKMGMKTKANLPRDKVKATLAAEGGIKPAARKLGVSHSTLRGRYPELCLPYIRKVPVKIDEEMIERILECAADPNISLKETAQLLGVGQVSINRYCKRRGVQWLKVKRSKVGEVRSTYRGKPNLRSLVVSGLIPELADKADQYRDKPLPKRLYHFLYRKYLKPGSGLLVS